LVFGFWFLVFGFWFLVFGFWFLVFGFWLKTSSSEKIGTDLFLKNKSVPIFVRLSLHERLWGGRVSDPPVKAGAERKKKTAFQGFFWREGTPEGRRAGGAGTLPPRSRARGH